MSTAPINWQRGLFRVWIVASLLWMAGIVLPNIIGSPPTIRETGSTPAFDPSKPYDIIGADGTAIHVVPTNSLVNTAALAIVPPICLLGLGLILWWVTKGFKPRSN